MHAVLSVCLVSAVAATPADKLVDRIVHNNHKRVAVIPAVVYRRGDAERTVGPLGPRAQVLISQVYKTLVARRRGRYEVVPTGHVQRAVKEQQFTAEHLSDPTKTKALMKAIPADSLVTLSYSQRQNKLDTFSAETDLVPHDNVIEYEVIDGIDNTVSGVDSFIDELDLSKAAYQGQSWELRRWVSSRLQNRAFDLRNHGPMGFGRDWERRQYVNLVKQSRPVPHPLEIADFPLPVVIKVGNQERRPQPIRGGAGTRYLVELNPGEQYRILMKNDTDKRVYAVVYVDGVSVRTGSGTEEWEAVEPQNITNEHLWSLSPHRSWRSIQGWTRGMTVKDRFKITPRYEGAAFGVGFEERIGQITVIYFTEGLRGIPQPGPPPRGKGIVYATGFGDTVNQQLEFSAGDERGLMLAAVTYLYRARDEIAAMRNDPFTGGDRPRPDTQEPDKVRPRPDAQGPGKVRSRPEDDGETSLVKPPT